MNCKYWIQEGDKQICLLQGGGENYHWSSVPESSVPESPFLTLSKVVAVVVGIVVFYYYYYRSEIQTQRKNSRRKEQININIYLVLNPW